MTEVEEMQALEALLATAARAVYPFGQVFHLPLDVVMAFVRGVVSVKPDATVGELVEAAGKVGIPRSVLVRAARGERPAPPMPPPTRYSRRTRLNEPLW